MRSFLFLLSLLFTATSATADPYVLNFQLLKDGTTPFGSGYAVFAQAPGDGAWRSFPSYDPDTNSELPIPADRIILDANTVHGYFDSRGRQCGLCNRLSGTVTVSGNAVTSLDGNGSFQYDETRGFYTAIGIGFSGLSFVENYYTYDYRADRASTTITTGTVVFDALPPIVSSVPEPETGALLLVGLCAVMCFARLKRAKRAPTA
jgi:hypothetical protein